MNSSYRGNVPVTDFCHYLEISRTLLGGLDLSAVFALCFLGVKQKKTTFFSCSDEDFIDVLANKTINFYKVCHSGWCSRLYSNGKTKKLDEKPQRTSLV